MLDKKREPPEKAQLQRRSSRCCDRPCLKALLAALVLYILMLTLSIGASLFMPPPEHCAVEDCKLTPMPAPFPVDVGTSINIAGLRWPVDELDLTGVWWVHRSAGGAASGSDTNGVFPPLDAAALVSFAGGERILDDGTGGDGDAVYPLIMRLPFATPRTFGYRSSYLYWAGRAIVNLLVGSGEEAAPATTVAWMNRTYARVDLVGRLIKRGEGEWFHPADERTGAAYTLERVIDENGAATEKWANFLQAMGSQELRVWGVDDACRRRCELAAYVFLMPASTSCKLCEQACA